MPNEFPMNDPQDLWQTQPTEAFKMSADQLRRKAIKFQNRARFEAVYSIIAGLALSVFFARFMSRPNDVFTRLGAGVLSLWGIYYAYQAYQWFQRRRLSPDANLNITLQAYRSALEGRRDYGRHIWRRAGLTFCCVGVALGVVPRLIKSLGDPQFLERWAPVLVLFVLWLAVVIPLGKRNQRRLQREIEELRAFESQSRS
jgi:hypothetical protein